LPPQREGAFQVGLTGAPLPVFAPSEGAGKAVAKRAEANAANDNFECSCRTLHGPYRCNAGLANARQQSHMDHGPEPGGDAREGGFRIGEVTAQAA